MSSETVVEHSQDWRELLGLYYPRVRSWFTYVLLDRTAVDDLTQEVFVRLCGQLTKGEVMLNPWSYIKTIARNVFMEHLRAEKKRKTFVPLSGEITGKRLPAPDEICANQEASEAIPQLLGHLPVAQRCILVGRYFLGLTVNELAEAMGTAASTVVERHGRAVCQLRRLALSRGITV